MIKLFLVGIVCWVIGVFGWAQIIGSLQNMKEHKNLLYTLVLWIAIMIAVAYFVITKLNCMSALVIAYIISFMQIRSKGEMY